MRRIHHFRPVPRGSKAPHRRALVPLALASGALISCFAAASLPPSVGAAASGRAVSASAAVADGAGAPGTVTAAAVAMPAPDQAENEFIADVNQLRTSQGLNALVIDAELTDQARVWASTMNDAGRIFHTKSLDVGISANWQKLGENVGVGGDVATLFQAFVDSPTHYENLVDPAYTHLGVGVVTSADGTRLYTAHRFMALMPAAPPPAAPRTPAEAQDAPPATEPPTTAPPTTTPAPAPTVPPPTVAEAPRPKLGPIEAIAPLLAGV